MLYSKNGKKFLSGTSEIHLRMTEPGVKGVRVFLWEDIWLILVQSDIKTCSVPSPCHRSDPQTTLQILWSLKQLTNFNYLLIKEKEIYFLSSFYSVNKLRLQVCILRSMLWSWCVSDWRSDNVMMTSGIVSDLLHKAVFAARSKQCPGIPKVWALNNLQCWVNTEYFLKPAFKVRVLKWVVLVWFCCKTSFLAWGNDRK